MEISREQFEKSKDYYNKYRKLTERHQSIMNQYIRYNNTLPMEYNTPIGNLDLSIRLKNVLAGAKVYTLGDMCKVTPLEMYRQRNFGKKCLNEMKEFLNDIGIEWGH